MGTSATCLTVQEDVDARGRSEALKKKKKSKSFSWFSTKSSKDVVMDAVDSDSEDEGDEGQDNTNVLQTHTEAKSGALDTDARHRSRELVGSVSHDTDLLESQASQSFVIIDAPNSHKEEDMIPGGVTLMGFSDSHSAPSPHSQGKQKEEIEGDEGSDIEFGHTLMGYGFDYHVMPQKSLLSQHNVTRAQKGKENVSKPSIQATHSEEGQSPHSDTGMEKDIDGHYRSVKAKAVPPKEDELTVLILAGQNLMTPKSTDT